MCIGCNRFATNTWNLEFLQRLVLKNNRAVDLYYCKECNDEDRFVHPESLMALRETWIVFAACWVHAARMRKDLLRLMWKHFRVCWKQDIVIKDLSEQIFINDYYCDEPEEYDEDDFSDDDDGSSVASTK